MNETYFISDTHFGHVNIIKYCKRPFSSVDEMDRHMIETWNSVVKPRDVVYHLGDFAFHKKKSQIRDLVSTLNGTIILIQGNHDHYDTRMVIQPNFPMAELTDPDTGLPVVLCHYPLRSWNRDRHGSIHLFGHVHGAMTGEGNSLDVGVDAIGYRPRTLKELKEILK